ncbi:serine hydrolase domain-containing protein [Streptomyces sp. NPDC052236]|uniref:serine hydrolase domain-containing protein n=1 Tax=Streptomyces sp. NPDC052236 TaxID=3365686 RepID=UPI0037D2B895
MNRTDTPTTPPATSPAVLHEPGLIVRIHPSGGPPVQAHTGAASLELAAPIEESTAFNVGSVAKQITAYLCVRAARDGLIALDRPVGDILPRFRIPGVTVAELVQHRGGVRDAESLLSLAGFRDLDHYTADDLLELAYRQSHRAIEPGRFLYSNTGYLLLTEVLRHVHGAYVQDIAEQEVFTPLGMVSARFKSDPREVIPGAASSYSPTAAGWAHQQRPVALPGPGSLWCTAADLDRWLAHLSREWDRTPDGGLPFEEHVSYVTSDHEPFTYGAGLYAHPEAGHTAVFHYGHEQGFSAAAHLDRSGLRVICLSNRTTVAADHIAATALAGLTRRSVLDLERILTQAVTRQPPTPNATPDDTSEAPHTQLGTYACEEVPGTIRLSTSGESLHLWRRGTRDHLAYVAAATYSGNGYTLTLSADPMRNAEGRLDSFILDLDRAPALHYRRCSN